MNWTELKQEVFSELTGNILPYWINEMTDPRGGYYGRRDGNGVLDAAAPKGLILNARILWAFSSAYRVAKYAKGFTDQQRQSYLAAAERAKDYLLEYFIDKEYGGAFWSLNPDGSPADTKKQFYAIAFAIYALSEFNRATGDKDSLTVATELFNCIEDHSFDPEYDGYLEACSRDWKPIEDMRLSDKDQNDAKTMNTHLHILEGYTNLYRVRKDDRLQNQLRNLIILFLNRITGPDGHLQLFFDVQWNLNGHIQSFGHDIECSWLLWEAVQVLGDKDLEQRAAPVCARIAEAGMEGFTPSEGMIGEWNIDTGERHLNRDWWVQAETVVGCFYRWKLTGEPRWQDAALDAWNYIKSNIISPDGEWYWGRNADGTVNRADDRAGFWKCPYHNSRMCLELLEG